MSQKVFKLKNNLSWSESLSIVEKKSSDFCKQYCFYWFYSIHQFNFKKFKKNNKILINQIKLILESFERVISLSDLTIGVIPVCEKDFFIDQSLLPFIST
jgi:hypothetical protein